MIPVRSYFRLLVEYLRPLRLRVILLTAVLLVSIALQLLNPQIVKVFIDRATTGASSDALVPLAIWFIVIAVAHQAFSVASTYLAEDLGWAATNEMRARLADHVLRLDMGFHKEHTPGELIERIDGDVTSLSNFFSAFTIRVIGNVVLLTGILVLLWFENVWVGFGLSAFSLIALAIMLRLQLVTVPWWKQVRATSAKLFGFVGEQLGGTEDIRANGGAAYMVHRFTAILREWLPEQVRGRMGFAVLWATGIWSYVIGTALVFWIGSVLFGNGAMTLGSVYLVFYYTGMTRQPMDQIRSQMEDFQKAGAGIARVEELFARTSALSTNGVRHLSDGALSVAFDDVEFAYDDAAGDERVLHGVSFELAPGRVLGVLGRSGSGKTTLARLLTRLYDPQSGAVLIGGVDAAHVSTDELRKRVGMVTQDVQLFRAPVRDNLTFFETNGHGDEHLLDVLHRLGLEEWLAALPAGLDSQLESGGGGLSAGQAQLLAFTRIFLRNPGLVILDEASSRLDPMTETLIERAVDRLLEGRTGIIIAHRLATVNRADDILIMEDGRVVEFGERVALVADPDSRLSTLLATGMEEVLA
jgi:ABC-type multidrug transport system fused ATPase/permease subunit